MLMPLAAILGAGLIAGAAFVPWFSGDYRNVAGPVTASLNGSQVVTGLVPLALVVVAALGAALMSRGLLRKLIGAVVLLVGIGVVATVVLAVLDVPIDQLRRQLVLGGEALTAPKRNLIGPILGVIGGLLTAAAGLFMVVVRHTPRPSAGRYDPPASRRDQLRQAGAGPPDPDQWWRAMDAGLDPTDDSAPHRQ